jgi:D-alanyl-D-alanine carboxypeptidase
LREVERGAFMALGKGRFRIGRLAGLAAALTALSIASPPAQAHHYRYHRYYAIAPRPHSHFAYHSLGQAVAAFPASPEFSALVVDANSGRTLYSAYEDGLRHPASITKVMTLYLLFEELDRGAMTLRTQIPISEHAAAQEPSKLGIAPGQTISVEDAIKAVVTRSANDVAVAIAEAVGHTEENFADMMTRKAHALGMSSTVYRNASGLPNDAQVTTARDLTILARSLEDRFPRYFRYFSTAEFDYAGEVIGNHNHLLGRIDGVDGIKTGYTRASGFNLLTSVHRDGRSLIAVVMGGRTAGARDRIMENLIADHIAEAATARAATMVADASPDEKPLARAAPLETPPIRPRPDAVAASVSARAPTARSAEPVIAEGDNAAEDDEAPNVQAAAFAPTGAATPVEPAPAAPISPPSAKAPPQDRETPADLGWVKGPDGIAAAGERQSARPPETGGAPAARPPGPEAEARLTASEEATIAARAPAQVPTEAQDRDGGAPPGGWMIQIGATDDPAKAMALLIRAREQNRSVLAAATPVTEKVRMGAGAIYRARFAVLDAASAESACRSLKRNGFSCFPARD